MRHLSLALTLLFGCQGDPDEPVCLETIGDTAPAMPSDVDHLSVSVQNCGSETLTLADVSVSPRIDLDLDTMPQPLARLDPGDEWLFDVVYPRRGARVGWGWFQLHLDELPEPYTVYIQIDPAPAE